MELQLSSWVLDPVSYGFKEGLAHREVEEKWREKLIDASRTDSIQLNLVSPEVKLRRYTPMFPIMSSSLSLPNLV